MSVSGASKILQCRPKPTSIKPPFALLSKIFNHRAVMGTAQLCSVSVANEESLTRSLSSSCATTAVACTTFNILAPIYKRLNGQARESEIRECWIGRNEGILEKLLPLKSSIVCLQEFWIGNAELAGMYERRLGDAGYATYKLARTNNRGDGLLTAIKQDQFKVLNYKELVFNDFGDRVSQLLHLDLVNFSQSRSLNVRKEALLVNTHLLFPHNAAYCLRRLLQVYRILRYIKTYCEEYQLPQVPIILCGDWNGSKKGNVYKFLRSQGFESSYDIVHCYTDNDADAHKWISHRNHRGNICGVDFIWLLNPTDARKSLTESFVESLFGNIKSFIKKESNGAARIPDIVYDFKNKNHITYSQFCQALTQAGLTSDLRDGITSEEMKDFWNCIDTNGDGIVDLSELNSSQQREHDTPSSPRKSKISTTIAFDVKKAALYPPEVEKGVWPDYYSLSDHAQLTIEFAPMLINCS
ncbi:hypothetical protein Sjap_012454 [Stephania japonica]|uniref:EF-hand domain-containing protein n=1 Tax=Stephania japonica TaxID=461633 RepID=A0AAP0IXZ8_9MAGN